MGMLFGRAHKRSHLICNQFDSLLDVDDIAEMPRVIRTDVAKFYVSFEKSGPGNWIKRWHRKPPNLTINPQIRALLDKPTWSVASLLAPNARTKSSTPSASTSTKTEEEKEITREKLHHLLKLAALPPPKDAAEEKSMLETLRQQIHFVKEIQKVDTTGIEPLVAIRDETEDSIWHNMITEKKLQHYLDQEEKVGRNGTIRRRKDAIPRIVKDEDVSPDRAPQSQILQDPFLLNSKGENEKGRRIGNYFYVQRSKSSVTHPDQQQSTARNFNAEKVPARTEPQPLQYTPFGGAEESLKGKRP